MRAGFLTLDVTPTHPVPLAGYAAKEGPFARVDSPLEANIATFVDDDGNRVVLGSVDTLFIGEAIREAIADGAGVPRNRLILVSTHTHNAPSLAPEVPQLGQYNPAYGDMVVRRIGEAVRRLAEEPAISVSVGYARQHAPFNINRRRPAWVLDYPALRRERRLRFGKVIALAPFRQGVVDPTLRCIVMRDEARKIRAIIWSFACHPNRYPFPKHVSPDFPGLVRERLRGIFGTDCVVIYLPGLAGSAIPDIPFPFPRSLGDLFRIALPFNPIVPWFTPGTYGTWTDKLASAAATCVHAAGQTSNEADVSHRCTRSAPIFLSHASKPNISLDLVRLDFGKACGVVAMTGEVIGEWAPILHPLLPEGWIATGYLAGPCLYVPTDQAVREGGYEADRFRGLFDLCGNFVTGLDRIVSQAAADLLNQDRQTISRSGPPRVCNATRARSP